jgi:predicted phage replisome organizer
MADVKWIKIVTDVFDDEKMLLIDGLPERDGIIVIWFKLLCMAGKQNNGGVLMLNDKIAYTDEMLATIFRRPVNTVRLALEAFQNYGMIEIVNNTITIPNWEKHQSLDALTQAKEKTRQRVAKHREKQKLLAESNDECNVTVTLCNADRIDIDKDKIKNKKENNIRRFTPPTIEDVKAYCVERNNNVDAERFVDYYTSNGWKVGGKSPMKDWKAAVRNWERSSKPTKTYGATGVEISTPEVDDLAGIL